MGTWESAMALDDRSREVEVVAKATRRKASAEDPLAAKCAGVEKEPWRLRARAERAEALVELQKKVSEILGIELKRNGEKDYGRMSFNKGTPRVPLQHAQSAVSSQ